MRTFFREKAPPSPFSSADATPASWHGSSFYIPDNLTTQDRRGAWDREGSRTCRGRKCGAAIVGVGNCASSLVQGIELYRNVVPGERIPGLMHVDLGGYHVGDVEIVAAFDVDANKVGRDVAEAIFAPPNNTYRFATVPRLGVEVRRGTTLDGLGKYLSREIQEADAPPVDVARILRETRAEVVVSYLPVGSEEATQHYVEAALEAGCGFVNCIPVFIASRPYWQKRFEKKGLPIIGDDIKSQVGATITHRLLTQLFRDRGVRLDRTYQLNFGGNTDFLNMLERERLESKKISKTRAVTSLLDEELPPGCVHVGPRATTSPWLERPQVLLHPDGGDDVRQCPAPLRGQARGLGFAELGRRGDRRGALRQAGPGPRDRRRAHRTRFLFHEVAAGAAPPTTRPRTRTEAFIRGEGARQRRARAGQGGGGGGKKPGPRIVRSLERRSNHVQLKIDREDGRRHPPFGRDRPRLPDRGGGQGPQPEVPGLL